jgi:hypothetical protein
MSRIIPIVTLILGLGVGAGWGYHSGAAVSRGDVMVAPEAPPVAQAEAVTVATSVNNVEAAQCTAFRQELTKALASHKDGPGDRAAAAPAVVSAEDVAARQAAQTDIEALVAGNVWGNEQRSEFRAKLAMLDSEQQKLVMQNLVLALNSGAMKLQTNGPPF